jgi:hypothetical protein
MPAARSSIRPFRPDDLPAMQRIRKAAFSAIFQSFRNIVGEQVYTLGLARCDSEQAQLLEDLCRPNSAYRVFVVSIDDAIVGFFSFFVYAAKRTGDRLVCNTSGSCGRGHWNRDVCVCHGAHEGMWNGIGHGQHRGDPSHTAARRAYEKAGFGHALPSVFLYKVL